MDTFNRAPKRSRFSFVDSGALVDVRKSLSTRNLIVSAVKTLVVRFQRHLLRTPLWPEKLQFKVGWHARFFVGIHRAILQGGKKF